MGKGSAGIPLVVVTDETVLDEVLRLAAAVDCTTERAPDLVAARSAWASAPLVVLDEDTVATAAEFPDLPRRAGVFLVCKGPPASTVWQNALNAGVERVVSLPEGEAGLIGALADAVEGPGDPDGCVIGVVGGRGGAGASVLAAAIGLDVSRSGGAALLVDCDPLGGGVDLLLGAENEAGVRWPALRVSAGRVPMSALREALPQRNHGPGQLSIVSCDRKGPGPAADAVTAVVESGRRAGRTVVCDLPRYFGAGARSAVRAADLIVLVVPAEVRACVAAKQVLQQAGDRAGRVRVLVRSPAPGDLTPAQVADSVGAPFLALMQPERGLGYALENGGFEPKPNGPLAGAVAEVLAAVRTGQVPVGAGR